MWACRWALKLRIALDNEDGRALALADYVAAPVADHNPRCPCTGLYRAAGSDVEAVIGGEAVVVIALVLLDADADRDDDAGSCEDWFGKGCGRGERRNRN